MIKFNDSKLFQVEFKRASTSLSLNQIQVDFELATSYKIIFTSLNVCLSLPILDAPHVNQTIMRVYVSVLNLNKGGCTCNIMNENQLILILHQNFTKCILHFIIFVYNYYIYIKFDLHFIL